LSYLSQTAKIDFSYKIIITVMLLIFEL